MFGRLHLFTALILVAARAVGSTPTVPATPTGLVAVPGSGFVWLSWPASGSAVTGYHIYRGTASGGESTTPVASAVGATSYDDTGLTNGTTYYYKIAAYNDAGSSAESAQAHASPNTTASVPYPVTTHPRLWMTAADLARYRSWAVTSNPIYEQGMAPLLSEALDAYNNYFFPGGKPANPYPDAGDDNGYDWINGVSSGVTEDITAVLAFNSLIDPNPAKRVVYAQDARNMLMYAMNLAALGHLTNAPFRDQYFALFNRANGSGERWPLTVDWIYDIKNTSGQNILTNADKATIRKVFMMWENDNISADVPDVTGHPTPVGVLNSHQILPGNKPWRMASNNYYLGHARLMTMMALAIDPADDPPLNPAVPTTSIGNTLRSYLLDANGAWLYQIFAMMGDPKTVATAYGIAGDGAGFGLASGGLPPEGMLYGHSFSYLLGELLALQTAGFNNQTYCGPQIQMIGAPVWDRYVQGQLSSLTPAPITLAGMAYMGPVYQLASYGDLLRTWATPEFMQQFTLLSLLEQENGNTQHVSATRWYDVNAIEGGSGYLLSRISNPWAYGTSDAILYYMIMDPAAKPAPDPRPALPLYFFDPAAGRVLAHSNWTPTGSFFDYRASWESIYHQNNDGGQFEYYRKGEWLTKELSNYDSNAEGLTVDYHNTISAHNWCGNGTPNLAPFETNEWANGSQFMLAQSAGDPSTVSSTGPGYVYASSNLTPLYNRPEVFVPGDAALDVTLATRSIVWFDDDYIVIYDRADTRHAGLFKQVHFSLVTNPTIKGSVATETMADGQKLYLQTLLPAAPAIAAINGLTALTSVAMGEPTKYIMTVEDTGNPAEARFLHVLQGANAGTAMTAATTVTNTAGVAFDGAAFGTAVIYFPVNYGVTVTSTTLPAPKTTTTMIVTGLTANAIYKVTETTGAGGKSIVLAPSSTGISADSAGLLKVTI